MERHWHSKSEYELEKIFKVNFSNGLLKSDADYLLSKYGPNELIELKRQSLLLVLLNQFKSPLIYLLLIAAAFAFWLGEARDSAVILVVIFLNAIIGMLQEYRAEKSLLALKKISKLKSRVLREGNEILLESSLIVPGDILLLSAGDVVPADARILHASDVRVTEAALTGESVPVFKTAGILSETVPLPDRINMIYAGTYISTGRCVAITVATGYKNEIGKIANMAATAVWPKTQLEIRVQEFSHYVLVLSVIVFFLVIGIGLLRNISFKNIFMIAISQMVSLVPEGLPVAMTIVLAIGVQRMAKRKAIVRKLSAVETLGATTIICTDKTGTLTKNEMTVTEIYLPASNRKILVTGTGFDHEGSFVEKNIALDPSKDRELIKFFEAISLCNDSQLVDNNTKKTWSVLGDPTEGALLIVVHKAGLDPQLIRKQWPRLSELPFTSELKMMATLHKIAEQHVFYIKGAPEVVIELCQYIFSQNGECIYFDEMKRQQIKNHVVEMAESGMRILAIAFIGHSKFEGTDISKKNFENATLIGLLGQIDPPREEVEDAISRCKVAGIRPVMVTGDHKTTGTAIAKTLGIWNEDCLVIDGQELEELSDKELDFKIQRVSVFARVQPAQKLRIVEAFQRAGHVVAMTGDGVNDAPALAKADVGVAMGMTGTEVAKESAKIVILDDNFATIVEAINEGRLVYQNIKKLLLFLLVTSIDEIMLLFIALVFGFQIPLHAVQILWINLVTEGMLTLNLIMEPAEGNEMRKKPILGDRPLLDLELLKRIPLMVLASVTSTFGWFLYRTNQGAPQEIVSTETFTVLVVCQWFNVLNCRSSTSSIFNSKLYRSPWLIGGLLVANVLQLAVVYWPPLGQFFHTTPIGPQQFLTIGLVGSLVLWAEEIRKMIIRNKM